MSLRARRGKVARVAIFRRRAERRRKRQEKERASEDLSGRLVTTLDPTGAASEAYRTIRTNLIYSLVDLPLQVIVFTSPGPQEGKSTICANLGVTLAEGDNSTLILDCDFRRPVLHKIFGLRNLRGIVNVLAGEHRLEEVWQEPLPGLKTVTVGPVPPNPSELLGSQRFAEFLERVRQDFDYVLIDAPPIELVSDPAILATQGDGALLVVDAQKTRKGSVRRSMRSLEAVGANVLGTVMNNVKAGRDGYYGYRGYNTYG
jgi:receptor protein-tyrosine kinase